ncbi:MAG: hypothetical protein ACD_42C00407G0002 [uncultured bacterium]|nr:MAG: hypothetical protein ACD_42C00407G0002 [uncultured bacterium]OGT32864.1 MAG: 5-formyltetrahydrofolate cyclo-ligase [Gammaproteobacteria bacterium RIFCSPHIGHO2_02_FULL_39_13]OGT50522.1 MAG: 5-formyltetrahydrofolate cyclo-ligase [Gammaproteobacteria bacterium RIFCSPHIGHO2_12_FULL_39_24]
MRKKIRDYRKNLSLHQVQTISKKISDKIIQLPEFVNSKKIAGYISDENEIDLFYLISHTRECNKLLYLPVISANHQLDFYLIDSTTQFIKNKFGMDEPVVDHQQAILPEKLDLILIPLVAFDIHCNRLGRGAGYYDRTLAFAKNKSIPQRPTLIGAAYEFQKVDNIIPESWDVPMDYVVTEEQIYQNHTPRHRTQHAIS